MSDARSLLRARKADTASRINHPYAAYNASGQLRCTVCVIGIQFMSHSSKHETSDEWHSCFTVIKNAAAWAGHLGSKTHRTNVAQLKAKEFAEAVEKLRGKRKEPEPESQPMAEDVSVDGPANKKQRRPTEFPTDFFSDPNHPMPEDDVEEDDINPPAPNPPEKAAEKSAIDLEWEEFQRTVINAPTPVVVRDAGTLIEETQHENWNRATVFAEPELAPEVPEGFPERTADQATTVENEATREPTTEELAAKKAQDERELIMDRLLAEEQAQEDADNRVTVLKARLDGIRKRKEAARLMKKQKQ
jgi:zinc finger protein 830